MAKRQQPRQVQNGEQKYKFTEIQLFKNQTLATGSYGAVFKAKCDQLICAAKLLYPVLFQMTTPDPGKEYQQLLQRFEEECQFLSHINHPNIVQYLGTCCDPETNAPVLLMELMDKSLTQFLESSPGDIPYHIQVNLCYDIAQALAFLHANGIIHCDLSSNNVLLIADSRAKVTGFLSMTQLATMTTSGRTPALTQLATMTICPGSPAFMSPEALDEPPVYTEKLDNFSFGVLVVQIVTQKFPKPTDRFKVRELFGLRVRVGVPEVERRQTHISLIKPTHPLLPIALNCLKDKDVERPSSQQLCQTLDALKTTTRYEESSQQDVSQLLRNKDEQIRSKNDQLQAKDEMIQRLHQTNKTLHHDKQALQHEAEAKERKLRRLNQQLESSEEIAARLQQAIDQRDIELSELRQMLAFKDEELTQNLSSHFHQVTLQDELQIQTTPTYKKPFISGAGMVSKTTQPTVTIDQLLDHVGITRDHLDHPCCTEHLTRIAQFVPNWYQYATLLELTRQQKLDVKADALLSSSEMKAREVMSLWQQAKGFTATYFVLVEKCLQNKDMRLAETICNIVKDQISSTGEKIETFGYTEGEQAPLKNSQLKTFEKKSPKLD